MGLQIALCFSEKCEQELLAKGFEKREVYIKQVTMAPKDYKGKGTITEKQIAAGDADFFSMRHKPHQFVTTSYWGAEYD